MPRLTNNLSFALVILITLGLGNICCAPVARENSNLFPERKITDLEKSFIYAQTSGVENSLRDRFGNAARVVKKGGPTIGKELLDLAVIYWVNPNKLTLGYLKDWCREAIKIKKWGNKYDLEISHLLFALSVVYDWHKEKLGKDLKQDLKEYIYSHAKDQYKHAVKVRGNWWSNAYWQNHSWINYTAILASGMALSDDYPETRKWVDLARQKIEQIIAVQSDDGSNHEGLNYSVYGNLWLVRALTLMQSFDKTIFDKSAYLKNWYKYFEAHSVNDQPDTFFDTGDSTRRLSNNPCEIFLRLYQVYGIEEYKELYSYYLKKHDAIRPGFLTAVYGLLPGEEGPGIKMDDSYFSDDLGIFIEKQPNIPMSFLFKSGIPGGRSAHTAVNRNMDFVLNRSHEHPDQNSFIIWQGGQFLISDTGYTKFKLTADHNSLLINNRGQLGERGKWFRGYAVKGKTFSPNAGLTKEGISADEIATMVSADSAEFYPTELGLKEFLRTILWIKKIGFVVFDRVSIQQASDLKLVFHSDLNIRNTSADEFEFRQGDKVLGTFLSLFPQDTKKTAAKYKIGPLGKGGLPAAGEKIIIEHQSPAGYTYFVNVIFADNIRRPVDFEEKEKEFSLRITDGDAVFSILLKKEGPRPISWQAVNTKVNDGR